MFELAILVFVFKGAKKKKLYSAAVVITYSKGEIISEGDKKSFSWFRFK
jgi:hypothetical protein